MPKKVKLKVNTYRVVSDEIETSIPAGIRKFLKYHDGVNLTDIEIGQMTEHIFNYVMLGLCEVVDFDD